MLIWHRYLLIMMFLSVVFLNSFAVIIIIYPMLENDRIAIITVMSVFVVLLIAQFIVIGNLLMKKLKK